MHVTVTDPQNHGEGRNKHTSYCIHLQPNDEDPTDDDLPLTSSSVRRRYSDFQWIYHRLTCEKPGLFIPVIHHETAIRKSTRFNEQFVEERRCQLELFLRKVMQHPELRGMDCVHHFLMADDEYFEEMKKKKFVESGSSFDVDASVGASSAGSDYGSSSEKESLTESNYFEGGGRAGITAEKGASVDGKRGGGKAGGSRVWREKLRNRVQTAATAVKVRARSGGSMQLERTTNEETFDDITHYITDVELLINSMATHISNMTERDREVADGMKDMSKHIFNFVRTQSSKSHDSTFVAMLGELGVESGHLSEMYDDIGKKQSDRLDSPMQDMVLRVQSAKRALEKRTERRVKYTAKQQDIKSKKAALDKQFEKNSANTNRLMNCRMALTEAERIADAAKHDLDVVSKRILKEMERFKVELEYDVRKVLADNARLHVEHGQRAAEEWENILPSLVLPSDNENDDYDIEEEQEDGEGQNDEHEEDEGQENIAEPQVDLLGVNDDNENDTKAEPAPSPPPPQATECPASPPDLLLDL